MSQPTKRELFKILGYRNEWHQDDAWFPSGIYECPPMDDVREVCIDGRFFFTNPSAALRAENLVRAYISDNDIEVGVDPATGMIFDGIEIKAAVEEAKALGMDIEKYRVQVARGLQPRLIIENGIDDSLLNSLVEGLAQS